MLTLIRFAVHFLLQLRAPLAGSAQDDLLSSRSGRPGLRVGRDLNSGMGGITTTTNTWTRGGDRMGWLKIWGREVSLGSWVI